MSRNSAKKKKSTSKYRKFKISPLIPVIAIIEVIVLVVISTYAWFIVSQEKEAYTGIITVDADSGLDIDFKNASYQDKINLWDYVPDDFEFTPVTSLDGRNVFVPTSGTFGNDTTNNIVYRDATINDINTKYVDVDFMLTNTTEENVNVYLNNNSHFRVYNNSQETAGESQDNSRALRLAFYTNDAKHGNVGSSIMENTNNENARLDRLDNRETVYFDKPSHWGACYAYIWKVVNNTTYVSVAWPGSTMTHVAGNVYSYSFSNTDEYTKIIFSNGEKDNPKTWGKSGVTSSNVTQTKDLNIVNNTLYQYNSAPNGSTNTNTSSYTTKTVYFLKPDAWSGVRAHAYESSGSSYSFTSYPGDVCTNCGANVYSYTFPTTYNNKSMNGIVFNDTANQNTQTVDLTATDGTLYYWSGSYTSGKYNCTAASVTNTNAVPSYTVYFYNSVNWSTPYAKITKTGTGSTTTRIPLTSLSAGVYYASVPVVYNQVAFEDREGFDNITTAQTGTHKYTRAAAVTDGQIYRPETWTSTTGYTLSPYSYTDYVGDAAGSYAVISPGVSAGFQRAYTPVVNVASTTGAPTQLVPAFASSIDNYIKSSDNAMFTIPANGMLDLSMIIWLEGTDKDCTSSTYAAKNIDLYLEFSTSIAGQQAAVDSAQYYTYRFYDKTRECWTSDRLTNAAGVSVAPVMQLYDATDKRGYLMHAASTTDYNGTRKIDRWECSAPATLKTEGHDLFFRRVDPYNEDEVWNYWHPGNANNYSEAFTTVSDKGYVSFTAFSDGAPASSTTDSAGIPGNTTVLSAASTAGTPSTSCGGLWGTYETTLLTVVDNTYNSSTGNHWLNSDGGVLTIKYEYTYPTSGKKQTIEYKASGPYKGQFYYFVVPKLLNGNVTTNGVTTTGGSSRASSFTFHRFWGFDSAYAMNIYERNKTMSYNNTGTATISSYMRSYYVWLGQSKGASTLDQSWFGDLLYVNLSTGAYNNNGNEDVMNNAKYRLHIWDNSGNVWDEYLYVNNGSFAVPNFTGLTYVAVLPYVTNSGSRPTGMKLQRYKADFSTMWNESGNITVNTSYHNLFAYKWNGSTIMTSYNNDQVGYGWPEIPSYTDNN